MWLRLFAGCVTLTFVLVCGASRAQSPAKAGRVQTKRESPVEVVSLAESLEPLRKHFNANKDKHRFVALLSPT